MLKHYSIRLADNITDGEKQEIYNKIFKTLEEYISNILPIKFELEKVDRRFLPEEINDKEIRVFKVKAQDKGLER